MSKVLLFLKSIDSLDWEKVGLLLETDDELTTNWTVVKGVCSHFDKQQEENNEGTSSVGPTTRRMIGEVPTRLGETSRRFESGVTPMNIHDGSMGGATLEELTKMARDL